MRFRLLLSALVLVAAATLFSLWPASGSGAPAATAAADSCPQGFSFTYGWPAGTRGVYTVRWTTEERFQLAGTSQAAEGRLALEAELALRSFGREGDGWMLGASLESLRKHDVVLLGQPAFADAATAAATLTGHEARVLMGPNGRVRAVGFDKDSPPLFRHLLQALLTEAQVVVPMGATAAGWEDSAATMLGTAPVRYGVTGPLSLTRSRGAHSALHVLQGPELAQARQQHSSKATSTLDARGWLEGLKAEEALTVSDAKGAPVLAALLSLELELARVERFDVAGTALPRADVLMRPGELKPGPDAERQALAQRVDGLTAEELLQTLRTSGNTGRVPDHNRWLWRATGLLKQQPELAKELATLFAAPETTGRGRALVMDLLAAAGTPQAQAVMREALDSRVARKDGQFPLLMQRLSLVETPEPESATWLAREREAATRRGEDHVRRASAMSLGAAAGGLWRTGHEREAREHADALRRTLESARDAEERAVLVRALGNAALPEQAPLLRELSRDAQAPVREAVATALRRQEGPEATAVLLGLVQDPVVEVQRGALAALVDRPLTPDELGALLQSMLEDRTARGSDGLLVSALTPRLEESPRVAQALRHLLARSDDGELQARIRSLLASVGGPG